MDSQALSVSSQRHITQRLLERAQISINALKDVFASSPCGDHTIQQQPATKHSDQAAETRKNQEPTKGFIGRRDSSATNEQHAFISDRLVEKSMSKECVVPDGIQASFESLESAMTSVQEQMNELQYSKLHERDHLSVDSSAANDVAKYTAATSLSDMIEALDQHTQIVSTLLGYDMLSNNSASKAPPEHDPLKNQASEEHQEHQKQQAAEIEKLKEQNQDLEQMLSDQQSDALQMNALTEMALKKTRHELAESQRQVKELRQQQQDANDKLKLLTRAFRSSQENERMFKEMKESSERAQKKIMKKAEQRIRNLSQQLDLQQHKHCFSEGEAGDPRDEFGRLKTLKGNHAASGGVFDVLKRKCSGWFSEGENEYKSSASGEAAGERPSPSWSHGQRFADYRRRQFDSSIHSPRQQQQQKQRAQVIGEPDPNLNNF